ncbi:hypothetical protein NKI89_30140 [Mesorhizobium sp. M0309]|uniref:UPF0149 family protein n=1 Tax=Mesorhizobium sp. M0309 TaxID=2956933 RepID=UPI0033356A20
MGWPHQLRWITALLAVPHSVFETGGTPEFAAIKAAADRFNVLGTDLREGRFSPRYRRKANGDIDVTDWCEGFMAAVNLNPAGWRDALDPGNSLNRLLRLPIMSQCKNCMGLAIARSAVARSVPARSAATRPAEARAGNPCPCAVAHRHPHVCRWPASALAHRLA